MKSPTTGVGGEASLRPTPELRLCTTLLPVAVRDSVDTPLGAPELLAVVGSGCACAWHLGRGSFAEDALACLCRLQVPPDGVRVRVDLDLYARLSKDVDALAERGIMLELEFPPLTGWAEQTLDVFREGLRRHCAKLGPVSMGVLREIVDTRMGAFR